MIRDWDWILGIVIGIVDWDWDRALGFGIGMYD